MIPRIIHHVWVGGPMPSERQDFIATWRSSNPDWELRLWNEASIDFSVPAIKQAYSEKKWAKVADIVRLLAVSNHGGIYLDTDFAVYKSLDPLREYPCFFGFQVRERSPDWVANGAFGAQPGHWFPQAALARICTMAKPWHGIEKPTSFGPKLVTAMLMERGLDHYSDEGVWVGDIFLTPTPVFYPFGWNEKFTPECIRDETLAAHFWAESEGREPSWVTSLPTPLRFARSMKHRLKKLRAVVRSR